MRPLKPSRTRLTGMYGRYSTASEKVPFLYIGRNGETLRVLTEAFGSGCHCDAAGEYFESLLTLVAKDVLEGPVVIEGCLGASFLQAFSRQVSLLPNSDRLIFILDTCGLTQADIQACRSFSFLHESLALSEQNVDRFTSQLAFLKRMKTAPHHPPALSTRPAESGFKRVIDVAVSLIFLLLLSPLLLLIAMAVALESKGPVLYISKRAGKGYRVFDFYKFRTMVDHADRQDELLEHLNHYTAAAADGPLFFKVPHDPRCTRVGRVLRATSLDEIPQFFNVLKGDMSLVGNRPLPLKEAVHLTTNRSAERFMAPAGITGLWQVRKGAVDNMTAEERLDLDLTYASRHNLMYDLWIMAQTPRAMLQRSGA